jgi:hypothetical protein
LGFVFLSSPKALNETLFPLKESQKTNRKMTPVSTAYWRKAGLNYLQYLSIASKTVRNSLKVKMGFCVDPLIGLIFSLFRNLLALKLTNIAKSSSIRLLVILKVRLF